MQRQRLGILFLLACSAILTLSACKNNDSPLKGSSSASGTTPAIDTTESAKEVQITDKDHRVVFRPKQGTTQRYHIKSKQALNTDVNDQLGIETSGKVALQQTTEYYIRQTVKAVKPDSSIELTCRIDSIFVTAVQDTHKVIYSSATMAGSKDPQFTTFNAILNQDFGVVISKQGNVLDINNLTVIANNILKTLPMPDSQKTAALKQQVNLEAQKLMIQFLQPLSPSIPNRAIGKDSAWSDSREVPAIAALVQFPGKHDVRTVVKGFEERNGDVLAVIDETSSTVPLKTTLDQEAAKADVNNYQLTDHIVSRLDDATGLLVQRLVEEKNTFNLKIESKQQVGKSYQKQQLLTSTTSVELLK